jgi:hypothetical protein
LLLILNLILKEKWDYKILARIKRKVLNPELKKKSTNPVNIQRI